MAGGFRRSATESSCQFKIAWLKMTTNNGQVSHSPFDPYWLKNRSSKRPPTEAASKRGCFGLSVTANRDGGPCPSHSGDRGRRGPCGRRHVRDRHVRE